MIKFLRHNQVYIILIGVVVALSMLFFGVDLSRNSRSQQAAITIGETEISYSDVTEARRMLRDREVMRRESMYRQIYGERYSEVAAQVRETILRELASQDEALAQQAIDKIVADTLLGQEARNVGLFSGDEIVRDMIHRQIFAGQAYDPTLYRSYLRQVGMSPREFEHSLQEEGLRDQLITLLNQSLIVSDDDARQLLLENETQYTVRVASLNSETLLDAVAQPGDEEIQHYYDENSVDFETEPAIQYSYVRFAPADFESAVELLPEDLEFYYADNQLDFVSPARARVRHIQINYGSDSSPEAMNSIRERAEEVHAKAVAGEAFDALALEYSEDYSTKTAGGLIGEVTAETLPGPYLESVFEHGVEGVLDLVSTDYGFHIIKVEEFNEEAPKEFDEVKAEIEKKLREREAPAYARSAAEDFLDALDGGAEFKTLATEKSLTIQSTDGLLTAETDPDGLTGLTAKLLEFPDVEYQITDVDQNTVVSFVETFKDREFPPLADVREKIVSILKKQAAEERAVETAGEILDTLQAAESTTYDSLLKEAGFTIEEKKGVSRNNPSELPPVPELRELIFSIQHAPELTERYVEHEGNVYLAIVSLVEQPAIDGNGEQELRYQQMAENRFQAAFLGGLLSRLKANTAIEIREGLL